MNRPLVWIPLLMYMAIKLAVLALYVLTAGGGAARVWSIFVGGEAGATLLRYPNMFYLLPTVVGRIDLGMEALVGVVFQAAVMLLFLQAMRNQPLSLSRAFAGARARYVQIVLVTICASVTLYAWFWLQHWAYANVPIPRVLIIGGFFFGGLCVQGLFVFALPIALLNGQSVPAALIGGMKAAIVKPMRAILLVAIPFAVTLPAIFVGDKTVFLVERLSPEIVIWIQVLQELMHWPAMVLLMGGLAALFARRTSA